MVARAGTEFGRLDILVVNAAATAMKPPTLKLNVRARLCGLASSNASVQEASKFMSAGGRVVMISGMDSVRYMAGHGVLGAAKAAMESIVRYFAFELGPRGITVNGVNFAIIDSDSSRLYYGEDFERVRSAAIERSALTRLPEIDEIAAIVSMLCRPEASFLTAQTIMVDGGLTLADPVAR